MHNFYSLNPMQNPDHAHSLSTELTVNEILTNPTFTTLFKDYYNDNTSEAKQDALAAHLNEMNYLIAFFPDELSDSQTIPNTITLHTNDTLTLLISTTDNREVYLPVFTDNASLRNFTTDLVYTLKVPAKWLWEFVLSQKGFSGIVINPNTIGWDMSLEHVRSLLDDIVS